MWCLTFLPQKTARQSPSPITVPVAEPLRSHLERLLASQGEGLFCPTLATFKPSYLSRLFGNILAAATIGQDIRASWSKSMKALSFHSLRHSLPTLLAAAGVPASIRMQITGHKSEEIHLGYTHEDLDAMRAGLKDGLKVLR
jgi:integrase